MTALKPFLGCLALTLCLCLKQNYCLAQDKSGIQFGKVSAADFTLPVSPIIDSNTNAVILSDIGDVHFVGNNYGWFSHEFKRTIRIKILNKKAFDLANVAISFYSQKDNSEKLDNLLASTYNLENGQVVESKLNKTDVFEDRLNINYLKKKFTLPAVKEGSIIEYTYTITSAYDYLPSWEFQSEKYPCLWSEYQVNIPHTMSYIMVRQGIHAYAIDKGTEGHVSYNLVERANASSLGEQDRNLTVSTNTVIHRWVMKNIPAFKVEHYLSTPANYVDKIDFQLAKTYDGQDYHDHTNSWKQATKELLEKEDFGGPLAEENDWLAELVDKSATGVTDQLEQAKSIYYYVTGHFTCNDHYDKYIKTTLRDVVRKNSGTVGDINLLLIAMLRKKGLQADPVVLSTRDFGFNLASYPVLQKLNYVIVRLKVSGKVYYLDAAHSLLGFGQLAGNCYTGHARIISNDDSASVYFNTDSLRENKTTLVLVSATDSGLVGSWQSTLGAQESYNLRELVAEKGQKSYFTDIQTTYGEDADISNGGFDSLSRREDPVKIQYEFRLKQALGAPIIYFNPLFADDLRENPFKALDRKYPVEMPYLMDDMYLFSMEIPEGYTVDELPKSTKVAFNGDQGSFEYLVANQATQIQLRCHLRLNKAYFSPEDYASLRDFFGFVVKKESETIVLKKK